MPPLLQQWEQQLPPHPHLRIVTSFQSFIALQPTPRRHGPRVLWQAISEIERRAYFELALGSVT